MQTTVLSEGLNAKWTIESHLTGDEFCTELPDTTDRFCIFGRTLTTISGQLAITLDIKAYWGGLGDHYYVYSNWAPNLGFDVLGPDPGVCNHDADHGIKGYERRMDSIAASLSNTFRTAHSSITTAGIAYKKEPVIQVTFLWLIFPIVLHLLISGFFITTVSQTRDLPYWKSSALALLWCEETGNNRLSTPDQIKTRGEQAKVELLDEGNSWRLTET
ncbi:hypothetical protein C7974DRAFT_213696 [Boeremia exigua]|uniref:uncharacterized protein n=1 Tax=Boeremia exigua TaxID=749465 RepID=UPI001E8D3C1A|nr:uncharacterized protein C7974DRAFT_213696 [Boeremia exigua]KAH6621936.1 hypothetical protein C7974DRAFT_213696 [Boeremia exigua]